jgi:hypothetical protein
VCNCNQKRAGLSSVNNNQEVAPMGTRQVKLIKEGVYTITGNTTGRVYVFKEINDVNWVDQRDLIYIQDVKELQVI